MKLHILNAGDKFLTLLPGNIMHPLFRIDSGKSDHHGSQTGGKEPVHRISELAVFRLLKVPQKPPVQLLLGKSRLQVQLQDRVRFLLFLSPLHCARSVIAAGA